MVKLFLLVLIASLGQGFSQRVLPKDYEFRCLPKDGQGMLGIFEDWSKLNGDDYKKMLEFDSLRKLTEVFDQSSGDFLKVQDTDVYKKLANLLCTKAYFDLDFYIDNAIAFHQYLLKEFATKKPTPIEGDKNLENFLNLTSLFQSAERQMKMSLISVQHSLSDKSVNEVIAALRSPELNNFVESFLNTTELNNLSEVINTTGIPPSSVLAFYQYYAETFWERSNNDASGGGSGNNPAGNDTSSGSSGGNGAGNDTSGGSSGSNSTGNSNSSAVSLPSVRKYLYNLLAFYVVRKACFLGFYIQ